MCINNTWEVHLIKGIDDRVFGNIFFMKIIQRSFKAVILSDDVIARRRGEKVNLFLSKC